MQSTMQNIIRVEKQKANAGFTLIEFATVLVIIIILVGGVLTVKVLLSAASLRDQISQIERYNNASRTFQLKYEYLPGDIAEPKASQFGFAPRGRLGGQGDGDNSITGFTQGDKHKYGWYACGEPLMFWVDLSKAELIDSHFSAARPDECPKDNIEAKGIADYYPRAKFGNDTYIYILNPYSDTRDDFYNPTPHYKNTNFFTISKVQKIAFADKSGETVSETGINVTVAYNIDKKIDDGMPLSGKVIAAGAAEGEFFFANGDRNLIRDGDLMPSDKAIIPSSSTCYDNHNNPKNPVEYSITQRGILENNCMLSFQFK